MMGVILPIGKRRKGLNRSRICLGGCASKEDASGLPKKVSFVFTERDALRKIVNRMIQVCFVFVCDVKRVNADTHYCCEQDCPKMCVQGDREDFLVSVIELLDEVLSARKK